MQYSVGWNVMFVNIMIGFYVKLVAPAVSVCAQDDPVHLCIDVCMVVKG